MRNQNVGSIEIHISKNDSSRYNIVVLPLTRNLRLTPPWHAPSCVFSPYLTAKYNPSTATFACQIPNFRIARSTAGAGTTRTNEDGTKIISAIEKRSVMLGFMTRK
jgi:hypothetical protein